MIFYNYFCVFQLLIFYRELYFYLEFFFGVDIFNRVENNINLKDYFILWSVILEQFIIYCIRGSGIWEIGVDKWLD